MSPSDFADKKIELGIDTLSGAPECVVIPEIAIRTFKVLRRQRDGAEM